MKRHTKAQRIKQIESRKDSSRGEHSPYWDYVGTTGAESSAEYAQANPDVLPENKTSAPSTPQMLMGEAIAHLQGRQREVYILTMREDKSLAEAAEILDIAKGTTQRFKERAIKFISQYCEAAIKAGRV